MSRWAPNARERLENAALDLFVENGYEETTVAQIADRAGMNRATFFRHFADKREVLFGGEDVLAGLFADAIRAAPPGATLTECLQAALAAAGVAMTPQLRAAAARRRLVVAANSELQERGLLKHARITTVDHRCPARARHRRTYRATGGGDGHARFQRRVRALDEGER